MSIRDVNSFVEDQNKNDDVAWHDVAIYLAEN